MKQPRVVNPGGSQKDFFKGRDADFIKHRDQMCSQLKELSEQLRQENAPFKAEGFVEVRLTQDAWAKSHRPVDKLFKPELATLVGGNEIADLVFRVSSMNLRKIADTMATAKPDVKEKKNPDTGVVRIIVPELKSETGAIEAVVLWGPDQRKAPSVDEAIAHLKRRELAAYYRVELFVDIGLSDGVVDGEESSDVLVSDFWRRLKRLAQRFAIVVTYDVDSDGLAMGIALLRGEPTLMIGPERDFVGTNNQLVSQANFKPDAHHALLSFLTGHPLVRSVGLPAPVEPPDDFTASRSDSVPTSVSKASVRALIRRRLPGMDPDQVHPRICLVDGGINSEFDKWVIRRENVVAVRDEDHGTNIASLLVAGKALNEPIAGYLEDDGCELIDFAMNGPRRTSAATFPTGVTGFLDQLDRLIQDVKAEVPFRIINLSLNVKRPVQDAKISEAAKRIDEIAQKHDVIFVISAGNAEDEDMRQEWPTSITAALNTLIGFSDQLFEPADTMNNVSVGALNPPGLPRIVDKAPARYSRRGTSRRTVKPDLCQFGGAHRGDGEPTGLLVTDANKEYRYVCGTSYAAPLVAKTLAKLDLETGGRAPREVLLALLYHSAQLHAPLDHNDLRSAAKQLVGYGLPGTAVEILSNSPSTFTFVFFDRLKVNEEFKHDFEWPQSLSNTAGECTGVVRATMVSSPPTSHRFGAEAVRMNLDLYVRQHNGKNTKKGDMSFEGRVDPVHAQAAPKGKSREASLMNESLKWSPIKVYQGVLQDEGVSRNWRFGVEYLERDKTFANMPVEGVPVAVVVTISDPRGAAPVADEMRLALGRTGIELRDIRAALRGRIQN